MKIIYDYKIFWLQKYGGISRYFCNLIYYSYGQDIISNIKVFARYYFNEYLDNFRNEINIYNLPLDAKKISKIRSIV